MGAAAARASVPLLTLLLLVVTALTTLLLVVAALATLLLVVAALTTLLLVVAALTTLLLLVIATLRALATLRLVVTALSGLAAAQAGLLLGVVLALLVTIEARLLLGIQVLLVPAVLQLLRVHPHLVEQPGVLLGVDLIHPLQLLRSLLVVPAELTDQVQDLTGIEPHEHSFSSGPTQACASQDMLFHSRAGRHLVPVVATGPSRSDYAGLRPRCGHWWRLSCCSSLLPS